MTDLTRALVGELGFERAAVWSAVGFGVTLATFRGAALLDTPEASLLAAASAIVTALGVVGFSRAGGGVVPSMLLAYGPFAAVLFETVGPTVSLEPGGGVILGLDTENGINTVLSVVEPFAVAVAAAVVVGGAGYVIGRGLGALAGPDEGDPTDARPSADDD